MKQQEIYQNMTKGEISLTKFTDGVNIYSPTFGAIAQIMHHNNPHRLEHEANAEMIVSLWNNVAAKGINPEGVEKMKVYCEAEESFHTLGFFNDPQGRQWAGPTGKRKLSELRKEALTAAKL